MNEIPESHRDLLQIPVVVLATRGVDDFPQVSAVWFVIDEDTIVMSLNTIRQKVNNLRHHPECTLFFIDPASPYRTLELRARAEIDPDAEGRATAGVNEKYGVDVRQNDGPGEARVAVRFHPVKFNTWG